MIRSLIVVFACILGPLMTGSSAAAPLPDPGKLRLASANVLVVDAQDGRRMYAKAADEVTPIASLTKLMTAMVVLDANPSLDEPVEVDMDDFDYLKGSHSRLRMGTTLSRGEMLRLALMSSENRAASSLARHYPGGNVAFVAAMNAKAAALGMTNTRFEDPTGLSPHNVSTANDLALMVGAAAKYPLIRDFTTTPAHFVEVQPSGAGARVQQFQCARQECRVGHPAAEDRLHPRSRALRGHAGDDRQPADRDRAARFAGQVHAVRRCAARQALARDRRIDAGAKRENGVGQAQGQACQGYVHAEARRQLVETREQQQGARVLTSGGSVRATRPSAGWRAAKVPGSWLPNPAFPWRAPAFSR